MRFVLMHCSIVRHDAICQDLLGMYRVLQPIANCYLFGEYLGISSAIPVVDMPVVRTLLAQEDTVAIYHHSFMWRFGEELLSAARAKVVIRYHGVTPPEYFAGIPSYFDACTEGQRQTHRLRHQFPSALWMLTSEYCLQDIGADGKLRYSVVAPLFNIIDVVRDPIERSLAESFHSYWRILTVGRIVPNKGHLFSARVLNSYRRQYQNNDIKLLIAGKPDPCCCSYYAQILETTERLGVREMMRFLGPVSATTLDTLYRTCDAYLCCSEHEGFCIPIVEAQARGLPVVARARAAVPETLGSGQILHKENPEAYAQSLNRLRTDDAYRKEVVAQGRQNYLQRFTVQVMERAFLVALHQYVDTRLPEQILVHNT